MRSTLKSSSQPVKSSTFLYEYQSHGLESSHKTSLFVVFDGETQHRFCSARIVLYCHIAWMSHRYSWGIRQSGPVTHSFRGHVHHAPPNNPTLPHLTVAFEVVPGDPSGYHDCYHLDPRSSDDELRARDEKSICVLLESEHSISPDTLFLSLDFEHTILLRTTSKLYTEWCHHDMSSAQSVTTTSRTVRVIPMNDTRPRISICCLPTEVLLKIFEVTDSCEWQRDLLSFAQVCRQWSCSLRVLFARLESSEWKNHCHQLPSQYLNPYELANALRETPVLGIGVQHLHLDQHNGVCGWCNRCTHNPSLGFTSAAIAILRATKNLQRLHLSQQYSPRATAFFSTLPKLHALRTLSITKTECPSSPALRSWNYSISTFQLARCMVRWPALRSLTVEHLEPGNIGMRRFISRPPTCALTQFCIRDGHISDKDLHYLTASSIHTLAQVTLDNTCGLTYDGLFAFLNAISQNVISLTIRDVLLEASYRKDPRPVEHALDAVVAEMQCLQVSSIRHVRTMEVNMCCVCRPSYLEEQLWFWISKFQ